MTDDEFTFKEAVNQALHFHLIRWLLAHSKNSATHALGNVGIVASAFLEGLVQIFQMIDDDTRAQIVSIVGESNMHTAAIVGLVLSIGMKMARNRSMNPFGEPFEEHGHDHDHPQ